LAEWLKDLAPSDELRKRFGHDPEKWPLFQRQYRAELRESEKKSLLKRLADRARHSTVTLIYGARDSEHNNAVVLKSLISGKIKRREARP
jgi:uncharacterized protein YeaO (DUF488 family)